MEELLQEAGMQDILALPKARVPVIKFVVGATGTKVSHLCLCVDPSVQGQAPCCYIRWHCSTLCVGLETRLS